MQNNRVIIAIIALLLLAIGYYVWSGNQEEAVMAEKPAAPQIISGECETVYGGEICTYGKIVNGQVVEFGATIPMATVENAPLDEEMVFPPLTLARIEMPAEIKSKTGIDHLGINWEVQGHPPATFLTPHFDFHFYTKSGAEIDAIDCSNTDKPETLPTGYVMPDDEVPGYGTLIGLCVPAMGMHALNGVDAGATEIFESTMIVGFYEQEVIFVEPMISRAKLLAGHSFATTVPEVEDAGEGVMWPNSFEAIYDEATNSYRFVYTM